VAQTGDVTSAVSVADGGRGGDCDEENLFLQQNHSFDEQEEVDALGCGANRCMEYWEVGSDVEAQVLPWDLVQHGELSMEGRAARQSGREEGLLS
jgi:hypothetical protein